MEQKEFSLEWAGRTLSARFTDLTNQASGSVIMKYGETVVLVTAVMGYKDIEKDYFPLMVDYEEKFYAVGKILGGRYMKKEGRPSEEAVLSGRIIDRTIRPLFNQKMRRDVHVVATVLSIDQENDPDFLAVIGASLALATSNIPWSGPVSAVKIGLNLESELIINPSYSEEEQPFNILVCGKDGNVNMIEAGALEVDEDKVAEAIELAVSEIEKIQEWQKNIVTEVGKDKTEVAIPEMAEGGVELFNEIVGNEVLSSLQAGKEGINDIIDKWLSAYSEKYPDQPKGPAEAYLEEKMDEALHELALNKDERVDGRALNEVRQLQTMVGGISNIVHGTGIFYRGGTHVMSFLTLGGPDDSQLLDGMEVRGKKRFMHHYNFPPYSTGETGRMGGFNRRAIGHGALAEKALSATIPDQKSFPYTIRLVSECVASNGSTSMGSICASTLALMDGGVPVTNPVAGIAMGLVLGGSTSKLYKILTDIQGPEDHHGDMDFKVAGTKDGITAIQLDIKVDGVPVAILKEAMLDAKKARLHILDKIKEAIAEPRAELAPTAPRILQTKVEEDEIGSVIGSGGKVIKQIQEETGADITIEDDGSVFITGEVEGAEKAKQMVEEIVHDYKVGEEFEGEVIKILDFGAVVKFGYFGEGLVHISEFAPFRLATMEGVVTMGEKLKVKVKELDDHKKPRFSVKAIDPGFAERKGLKPETPEQAKARMNAPRRDNHRGSRR